MRHAVPVLLFAALSACGSTPTDVLPEVDRPRVLVRRTDDFEPDGTGSHAAWARAEWTALRRRQPEGLPYETRFKMLHSPKGLYVLVDGTDRTLTATQEKDFGQLWLEDVFEVYLWPDERHPLYLEYQVSPLGKELPILVPNLDGKFHGWLPWMYEGGRKVAHKVSLRGGEAKPGSPLQGWRAELFVPYELLKPLQNVPPTAGSRWRANVYRMDYDDGRKTQWDWSPVGESFHEIRKFGVLVFE